MHVSSFLSIMHVYHVRKYPSILNKHLFAKQSTCTTCYNAARWPIDVLKSTRSGQYSSRPQKQNSSTVRVCAVVGPMPRWRGLKGWGLEGGDPLPREGCRANAPLEGTESFK